MEFEVSYVKETFTSELQQPRPIPVHSVYSKLFNTLKDKIFRFQSHLLKEEDKPWGMYQRFT